MEKKIGEKINLDGQEYKVVEGGRSCSQCSLLTIDGFCYKGVNTHYRRVFGECDKKYRDDGKDVYFV